MNVESHNIKIQMIISRKLILSLNLDAEKGGSTPAAKSFTLKKNAMNEGQALEILNLKKGYTAEELEKVLVIILSCL
jgi:hypothetical protein